MNRIYKKFSGVVLLFVLAISIFDGLLFQIQAGTIHEYLVRPSITKSILVTLLIPILFRARINIIYLFTFFFMICVICVNMIINGRLNFEGFNLYYGSIMTLFIVISVLKIDTQIKHISTFLVLVLYVSLLLGVAQWLGFIKLPTSIGNEASFIQSSKIYGVDRVFSIFSSGLNFGYASLAALLISFTIKSHFKKYVSIFLSLLCIYISYTRTIYILGAIAILLILVYPLTKYIPNMIRRISQIVIFPAFAFYLIYFTATLPQTRNFLSSESSYLRINSWRKIFVEISNSGLLSWLFGTGFYQGYEGNKYIIDNMYIAVLHNLGIVGLIAWIFYLSALVYKVRKIVDPNLLYLFETFIVLWLFAMVYNISVGFDENLIILLLLVFAKKGDKVWQR